MSRAINKAFVGGHLTANPEIRTAQNGTTFAHFRVAANRRPSKNIPEPGADFIDVTLVGNEADYASKNLKQGSPFYGVGRLQSGSFVGQDGKKHYTYEVRVGADGNTMMWPNLSINYNMALLMGRISSDVDYRAGNDNSKSYCSFNVAMDRDVKADENGNRPADFIPVKCFGYWADFVNKNFTKGSMIHVVGRIDTSTFDKQDGTKGYSFAVIAETIDFAEKKKENQTQAPQQNAPQYAPQQNMSQGMPQGQYMTPPQGIPTQYAPQQAAPQYQGVPQQNMPQYQVPPQGVPQYQNTPQQNTPQYQAPQQNAPQGMPQQATNATAGFGGFGGFAADDPFAGMGGFNLDGNLPFK